MTVKNYQKYMNLSRVLNSTFGTEGSGNRAYSTQSIKFDILDDGMIKVRYLMIVNFGSDTLMREMMVRYRNEAVAMLQSAFKKIKEEYKTQFPTETTPDFEIVNSTIGEDVEFLTFSQYSGSRKAYYRFGCLVEVD